MKTMMLITLTLVAALSCALLFGAGTTVKMAPVSLSAVTVSGGTYEVNLAPGITAPTNIRVGVVGPGQGHIQVKVKKLQGMSVGSLTNFTEATWKNVTSGDFFSCVWHTPLNIRTTNSLNNVVCIYVD